MLVPMRKVLFYSFLLGIGLVASQALPRALGDAADGFALFVRMVTMVGLSFIMIQVGMEFEINKARLSGYGWDYLVAATAATVPWLFACLYFMFLLVPTEALSSWDAWKESLLASRFAAPTSAGVLFSMLAAAGLGATWVFRKARILAIFDDLDTVLLMIPLKIAIVGLRWELASVVLVMGAMLWIAWKFLHRVPLPCTWDKLLIYAIVLTGISELIYAATTLIEDVVPVHIEVLLPAFVLGCIIRLPEGHDSHHPPRSERIATTWISAVFMLFVGLSMPVFIGTMAGQSTPPATGASPGNGGASDASVLAALSPSLSWGAIIAHVCILTAVINLGKMFPMFCYRKEASFRERLAVAIGLWPRGEVGAGVLVLSLSYGIGGPVIVIAMLSLAANLLLTGVFIAIIRWLLRDLPTEAVTLSRT